MFEEKSLSSAPYFIAIESYLEVGLYTCDKCNELTEGNITIFSTPFMFTEIGITGNISLKYCPLCGSDTTRRVTEEELSRVTVHRLRHK